VATPYQYVSGRLAFCDTSATAFMNTNAFLTARNLQIASNWPGTRPTSHAEALQACDDWRTAWLCFVSCEGIPRSLARES
jgi:hypothetical protein